MQRNFGTPRVTVVTPCRNPGPLLARCASSVRNQTLAGVEHVVVDGGSTDGTREWLEMSDLRWMSEPDSGQAEAINKGFRLGEGELLTWLNADDVLLPAAAELAFREFRLQPHAAVFYGDVEFVGSSGRERLRPAPDLRVDDLLCGNVIFQPGTFFTRDAIARTGGLNEDLHLALDFDFWLRITHGGMHGVYIPEVMAAFAIHPHSKTSLNRPAAFFAEEELSLRSLGYASAADGLRRRRLDSQLHDLLDELISVGRLADARKTAWLGLRQHRASGKRSLANLVVVVIAPRLLSRWVRRVIPLPWERVARLAPPPS